eukprot:9474991-Pyramimonas_sp.AAC.1
MWRTHALVVASLGWQSGLRGWEGRGLSGAPLRRARVSVDRGSQSGPDRASTRRVRRILRAPCAPAGRER